MDVTIKFKDGTVKIFEDQQRPGGSYENKILLSGGFVTYTDVYGNTTSWPSDDIESVSTQPRL